MSPTAAYRVHRSKRRLRRVDPGAGARTHTCTPRPANGSCFVAQKLPNGFTVITSRQGLAAQGTLSETFADRAMGRVGRGAGARRALGSRVCSLGRRAAAEVRARVWAPVPSQLGGAAPGDALNSFLANNGVSQTGWSLKHGGSSQTLENPLESRWRHPGLSLPSLSLGAPTPCPLKPLVLSWHGFMTSAGP